MLPRGLHCSRPPLQENMYLLGMSNKIRILVEMQYLVHIVCESLQRNCTPLHMLYKILIASQNMFLEGLACKLPPSQKNIGLLDTVNKRSPLLQRPCPQGILYEYPQCNCILLRRVYRCPLESQNMPLQDWVCKLLPLQKNTCRLDMVNKIMPVQERPFPLDIVHESLQRN